MEKRIAVLAVIINNLEASESVNEILHGFSDIIIGRMGIPYKERGVSVISVVVDADTDTISSLTGKLGKIDSVSVKAAISKN
ncbi:TM1266 family iron-only hydrogenase system putative regulator [Porcipelethomonas sp.]|uniref:TM1266 family iron-only hydrogenase system putative regulator n=1 Tax=Porcipelethomonas sp. TaxID=2981675 RepID=UPI003EF98381